MTANAYSVLSPTAILGYGFPLSSFEQGMAQEPDLIAVDAGSTDPGPYYLGSGTSFTDRAAVKRDLEIMLRGAHDRSIPCIIGSAGGAGARDHVHWTRNIIEEIAREQRFSFCMGVICADISKDDVLRAAVRGDLCPLHPAPTLLPEELEQSVRIVAQMGAEPVWKALDAGCQVVLCGRCYDPVPFAAPPIREGFDPGLAYHMGKILECAAIAATPGSGRDCVLGTIFDDCFEVATLCQDRRFTRISTAAHTLYEKRDPYHLPGPGGSLDLTNTSFEELDAGRVRVRGSAFEPAHPYTIKLEGVKRTGARTISIAGIRDPILVEKLGSLLTALLDEVRRDLGHHSTVMFHVYGKNGVMGPMEPLKDRVSHELGLIIDVVGPDQDEANAVCAHTRSTLLHYGYSGRLSTAGNLAFLFSPSDIPCGDVYEFNVYHLMPVDDPTALFPLEVLQVRP
jgi:hypothetical protein